MSFRPRQLAPSHQGTPTLTLLLALLFAGAPALAFGQGPLQEQTLPAGFLAQTAGGATNWPQNTTADHHWCWHYDSAEFLERGPILIRSLAVRPSSASATAGSFDFPSFRIWMAAARTDWRPGGEGSTPGHSERFQQNFLEATRTLMRTGPWRGGPVAASAGPTADWIAIRLDRPFAYDPTLGDDLIIEIEKCGTVDRLGLTLDVRSTFGNDNGGARYGHISDCNSPLVDYVSDGFVPLVRIGYERLTDPEWQANEPPLALSVARLDASPTRAALAFRCRERPAELSLAGDPALGHDIAIQFARPVAASQNGSRIPGGGVINLDLRLPILWQYGTSAPLPATPLPASPLSLPLAPARPLDQLALQALALDPLQAAGVRLSQAAGLSVADATPIQEPLEDEESFAIRLGSRPLCGPEGFPLNGVRYDTLYVHDNGYISFGAPVQDFSPTVREALDGPPRFGFWTDLDPSAGTIEARAPAPDQLVLSFAGMRFYGEAAAPSFGFEIRLSSRDGALSIDGLNSIGANPVTSSLVLGGDHQWLGFSPGYGASDPGPLSFFPGARGQAPLGAALYEHLAPPRTPAGPVLLPSLAAGLRELRVHPLPGGMREWQAY